MKQALFIAIGICFLSCKKQIDFNIPYQDQVLVVNSNLNTDSFISFNLSYTQSIKDNLPALPEDSATIEIFNYDTSILLDVINPSIFTENGYYQSKIKAQPASAYLVKIIISNKKYWTSDSVPYKTEGKITKTDSIIFQGKNNFYRIRYDLSDKQNYRNYYGLKLKHYYELYQLNSMGLKDTIQGEEWLDIGTVDPVLTEDENNKFSKKHLLFTDLHFNNNNISLSFGTFGVTNTPTRKSKRIVVFMEQYSFKGYQYYASLNEHIFYQNDPFSQPTLVKGNISNAFGAFIGSSKRADSISLKY